mmetsp:Transcript_5095/g.7038  ORF Transcript_5095/g.7038 Transcript_5095/m.7038 type:complete len:645 (+) Transcript_5095:216-2150(+)
MQRRDRTPKKLPKISRQVAVSAPPQNTRKEKKDETDVLVDKLLDRILRDRPSKLMNHVMDNLVQLESPNVRKLLSAKDQLLDENEFLRQKIEEIDEEIRQLGANPAEPELSELTIVHFNDVYNIESREKEPVGGLARFVSAVNTVKEKNPGTIVLFSGDAFSPSLMSTVTKGRQMAPSLNLLEIKAACLGNHDLDFGIETFESLRDDTNFPWIASNVIDKESGYPLGRCQESVMVQCGGKNIGILGLIEKEWLETLGTIEVNDVIYVDFILKGREIAQKLKDEGADMVIALTHMRVPNDTKALLEIPEVDLFLGGHDHHYEVIENQGKFCFKSGTDFREFTKVLVEFTDGGPIVQSHERVEISSKVPENTDAKSIVDKFSALVGKSMDKVLGETSVDLDSRFQSIRTKETNIGNFVADIVRDDYGKADIVLLNSGCFRSDTIHPVGLFCVRDLMQLFPMQNEWHMIEILGSDLILALENSVSMYPTLEGRFLQVSGVCFSFDPSQEKGQRVLIESVKVNGKPVVLDTKYLVLITDYLFSGKDGYSMFPPCRTVTGAESFPPLSTMLRNHFTVVSHANNMKERNDPVIKRKSFQLNQKIQRQESKRHVKENNHIRIAPQVDGRITNLEDLQTDRVSADSSSFLMT